MVIQLSNQRRRSLIEGFHRLRLIFSRSNFFQIKTGGSEDFARIDIYRKQRRASKDTNIHGKNLTTELENFFA